MDAGGVEDDIDVDDMIQVMKKMVMRHNSDGSTRTSIHPSFPTLIGKPSGCTSRQNLRILLTELQLIQLSAIG